MTELTNEEIAELRRLHNEATPGEWRAADQSSWYLRAYEVFAGAESVCHVTCCDNGMDEKDCHLIAAARNALPRLLDEVERLRAENAKLRSDVECHSLNHDSALDLLDKERAEVERLRAENQTLRSNLETLGLIDPDDIAEGERQAKSGEWVKLDDLRAELERRERMEDN